MDGIYFRQMPRIKWTDGTWWRHAIFSDKGETSPQASYICSHLLGKMTFTRANKLIERQNLPPLESVKTS